MSFKLLKSILYNRSYSYAIKRIYFQSLIKSYATDSKYKFQINTKYSISCYSKQFQIQLHSTQTISTTDPIKTADNLLTTLIASYKNNGYGQHELCEKLLNILEENLEQSNQLLTTENIQFLLHVFGTQIPTKSAKERMQLFQRLWKILKEGNLLTKDLYFQQLQVRQHNQIPLDNLPEFLNEVAKFDEELLNSTDFFSELLKVACSHGHMTQAVEIINSMKNRNFALSERNFNALIMGYGRSHDLKGCQTTIDGMQASGVPLTNETQTALFIAYMENHAKTKAMDLLKIHNGEFTVEQILTMMRTALSVDLDTEIINLLICGLPSEYTNGPDLSVGLRQLCCELIHNDKLHIVKDIISALPRPHFNDNQSIDTYATTVLTELFRAQIEEESIIEFAKLLKETDKNSRALHVVTEIAMRRNPGVSLRFLEVLSEYESLRPHYFWPLMVHNFHQQGEGGLLTTLNYMRDLNVSCDSETLNNYILPHVSIILETPQQGVKMLIDSGIKPSQLILPVLRILISQQKLQESIKVLETYSTKIDVLGELLQSVVQLSVNVRATKRYQQFAKLLMELSKHNENPKTDFVGQLLIDMLCRQERLKNDLGSFLRFLNEMQKIGILISSSAIMNVENCLSSIRQKKEVNESKKEDDILVQIRQTLNKMKERNLILAQNTSNGQNSNTSFVKHPRDMSLEDLECHLIELESKGMNTRGVLRRLLQLYVRDNHLEKALEIKAKCDILGVQTSPGMMASIFDLYMKVRDLPKAQETLEKLQSLYPGFQVDEHKLIDYAALLVLNHQFHTALELLAERASKQRIAGGNYVIKNVWNFLTNVAQFSAQKKPSLTKEKNLTREAFNFLRKHGYCNTNNTVLGPIVREYLLRDDINSAIKEFKKISEQYKHTPLQFELLSLLVRLSNGVPQEMEHYSINSEEAQKLLSEVTSIISKVHGEINMNSALVLAFAESGTENQLRRLLINPEFRINHEMLQKNCEHLGKEGSVKTLLRLAKGARGLNRAINEETIYNMLLKNFIQTNDYAAALDLYERLEADDDLKMSTEFLKDLVNLLKMNKVDIPSNIALRAHVL